MALKKLRNELVEMRKSMEKMTEELHETNIALQESLKLTSATIKEMSDNFSKILEGMKIEMDIQDTIIKNLGIDNIIPDFLRRKKK